MSDLRVAASVSVEGGQAAAELNKLAGSVDKTNDALKRTTVSAGQSRAAMANLGQQIGDISQGFALGISPMTIFAQQAGQVGFAMSGLGGKIGAVGALLSGPWGAAITGAAIVLGSLAAAHSRAGDAAEMQGGKQTDLAKATLQLDQATGFANRSALESIRIAELGTAAALQKAKAKRDEARAELEAARARLTTAQQDQQAGGARGANFGSGFVTANAQGGVAAALAELNRQQLAINNSETNSARSARFGRAELAARSATDPRARITAAFDTERDRIASLSDQTNSEALLAAAMRKRDAALAAITGSAKAATAAEREHSRELREAARDAERAAAAQKKLADATAAYLDKSRGPIIGQMRQGEGLDSLGQLTASIEDRMETAGAKAAKAFTASTLADAAVIGQAIGGGLGQAFTGIAALGFGTKNDKNVLGDFTGTGGRVTSLLQSLSDTFSTGGGKRFAGLIGTAAGGAATGSVISGIGDALGIKNSKTGAAIGGALGGVAQSLGIPGGEIIGSILGGLVGSLFGPKGSTTISSSGGKVSSSSTGSAAVQKATGAIGNTITDALAAIADQLGGSIGDFSVSIGQKKGQFRVDRSGQGKLNGGTVTGTDSESEALSLALADALRDGAVKTSPRVQAALLKYADNVNKAVAEALKVKGLEDLLSDRGNPFLAGFRTLETQLKQRLDVARANGFDLVEIEKINAEDRAKALKDTLASATGSVRNLLNDLTIGSGATGAPTQRLAGLAAERDRLSALARGGDTGQLDALASIVKQIDDLQKETFGSTAGFANGRADSVALLNDLIRQTEDRAKAAADQARGVAVATVDKLTELNASADDTVAAIATSNDLLEQIAASLQSGVSTGNFRLADEYAREDYR